MLRSLNNPMRSARFLRLFSSAPVHGSTFPTSGVVPSWASVDPWKVSGDNPYNVQNLVNGEWAGASKQTTIPDPMNGDDFMFVPKTEGDEMTAFLDAARSCPKTGLHNPYKSPERYQMYGEICHRAGAELAKPESLEYFAKLIARVMPKSHYQAWYETKVSADFLKNFGGDNPRFTAAGQVVPGDHAGQRSTNVRWPFGPVSVVSPFNFPLEIPCLQLMGALMMGNRPTLKPASTVAVVMEQYVRMLIHCGMPPSDMDFLNCGGRTMGEMINTGVFRTNQFTGSSGVSEELSKATHGKVKVEDAGFDWKILGPDVMEEEFVAWTCDQDAYACTGQKCSAQSILFAHSNWVNQGNILDRIRKHASGRKIDDLSVGPVLSHSTKNMLEHTERLLSIPGARLLFGGKELTNHNIPSVYGAIEPTAVFVPIDQLLSDEHFDVCTTEIFGPFQVVTEYDDASLPKVLEACERMSHHLTAAVVSNDPRFQDQVLAHTVNGTTYAGIRARTTGAPQNHWFGPAGDPRGAGIGTPYAIQLVWSCHREIIYDQGAIPSTFNPSKSS